MFRKFILPIAVLSSLAVIITRLYGNSIPTNELTGLSVGLSTVIWMFVFSLMTLVFGVIGLFMMPTKPGKLLSALSLIIVVGYWVYILYIEVG